MGVGDDEGATVGAGVGEGVGFFVGDDVGAEVGAGVGPLVGDAVGTVVGGGVGPFVGAAVGEGVGDLVGEAVYAGVETVSSAESEHAFPYGDWNAATEALMSRLNPPHAFAVILCITVSFVPARIGFGTILPKRSTSSAPLNDVAVISLAPGLDRLYVITNGTDAHWENGTTDKTSLHETPGLLANVQLVIAS